MSKRKKSKAEKVRSRKRKRETTILPSDSKKARSSKTSRDARPVKSVARSTSRRSPQVMVRGGRGTWSAASPKKRPSPRRRYDVTLSAPGAEIRLPSLPVVHNYWQIFSGFLSAALTILLIYLWNSPTFQVRQVEVEGLERFTAKEISMAIDVVGYPAFSLIPSLVEADLEDTYPGLAAVQVKVDWPANVVVVVEEREPVLAWRWEEATSWVDADGVEFSPRGGAENLLQVQALTLPPKDGDRFISPKLMRAVDTLAEHVPEATALVYDQKHGLGWQDQRGWMVYFGSDVADLALKQVVYEAIINRLEEVNISPALISVEYVNAPYYRLER